MTCWVQRVLTTKWDVINFCKVNILEETYRHISLNQIFFYFSGKTTQQAFFSNHSLSKQARLVFSICRSYFKSWGCLGSLIYAWRGGGTQFHFKRIIVMRMADSWIQKDPLYGE